MSFVPALHSDQFPNRRSIFHDVARAALMIEICGVERNSHVVINGRGDIARSDRPLLDGAAVAFGRSNNLPVMEATARHHHRHHHGPMVAAVGAVLRADLWRAAKFNHGTY